MDNIPEPHSMVEYPAAGIIPVSGEVYLNMIPDGEANNSSPDYFWMDFRKGLMLIDI